MLTDLKAKNTGVINSVTAASNARINRIGVKLIFSNLNQRTQIYPIFSALIATIS
jgi:hypothetical protein